MRRAAPSEAEQEVMDAAALLDVSEYDLLCRAYRRWYGREPDAGLMDRVFGAYMRAAAVPHWARFHAREILEGEDRLRAAAACRPCVPGVRLKGLATVLVLGLALAALVLLADAALSPGAGSCYFPPCY
jgi:hypothetical protein